MLKSYSCKDWAHFIQLSDSGLLEYCQVKQILGSGRGGQNRNKTANCIQLKFFHLLVEEGQNRSRLLNKKLALRKLRKAISLDTEPSYSERPYAINADQLVTIKNLKFGTFNLSHPLYPFFCGQLLDAFIFLKGNWAELAECFSLSQSQLTQWFRNNNSVKLKLLEVKAQLET